MSRTLSKLLLLAALAAGTEDPFMDCGRRGYNRPEPKPIEPMTPEREKAIMEGIEKNKHDFNIRGTIIRAKDRKTALKIYSRL